MAQMFFDQPRIVRQRDRQAGNRYPTLPRRRGREFRRKMAIEENQAVGGQPSEHKASDRLRCKPIARNLKYRFERQLRDRREVGETPILLLQRREPQFGEARDPRLPQRKNPRGLLRLLFESLELFQMWFGFLHGRVFGRLNHCRCCSKGLSNRVRQSPTLCSSTQVKAGLISVSFCVFEPPPPLSPRAAAKPCGRELPMLNQLTISELVPKLARREVSSREIIQACLDQIQRVEPQIRAFISYDAADILAQADVADKALASGAT